MIKMVTRMKSVLTALLLAGALLAPVAVPSMAFAQATPPADGSEIKDGLCGGIELKFDSGTCAGAGTAGTGLTNLIKTIINIISIIVGVVAVVMIIVGGLKYITSGGESSNVSSAKNTIIYAIIGLIIVALAQFVVRFVLEKSLDATT